MIVRKHDDLFEIAEMAAIHVSVPVADISEPALNFLAYYAGK